MIQMAKFKSIDRRNNRRKHGFSILEALVSLVVMGIAIAGIAELLWANTSWLSTLHNKFDTFYASRRFLKNIEIDLHQATQIDPSSDGKTLVFSKADESNFDGNGFLTYTNTYRYWIEPDTEIGSEDKFLVRAGSSPANSVVVLRGVVGPLNAATGQPVIFKYIERAENRDQSFAQSTDPNSPINISGVLINLELKRTEFGKSQQDGPNKTGIVLRDEIFLRNATLHAQ